mmetsp:Transcript_20482/g.20601  ORF Transcript_20482/g.20601 Transcript_20482/m.20601 type:complete len:308 (+) Transcript_20482:197-1120(+)
MALEDDTVAVVPSTGVGGRALTPSKVANIPKRFNTPQRSTSAPKSNVITKAILEHPIRNRAQSSTRKQRRWENDHLFGSRFFRAMNNITDDDLDEQNIQNYRLEIEWRSSFQDILSNPEALAEYLQCLPISQYSKSKNSKQKKINTIEKQEEKAWKQIEKRLRSIILRSISNTYYYSLLLSIEFILKEYLIHHVALSSSEISSNILEILLQPIIVDENTGNLIINLIDNSFYRLLIHTVCQFHGLKSKSISYNNERVIEVSHTHSSYNNINNSESYKKSLVNYLQRKKTHKPVHIDTLETCHDFVLV